MLKMDISKFQLSYSVAGIARSVLNLYNKMSDTFICVYPNLVQFSGRAFSINAEILENSGSKRNNRYLTRHAMRSQLFFLPRLVLSFAHSKAPQSYPSVSGELASSYTHHDVYLKPSGMMLHMSLS